VFDRAIQPLDSNLVGRHAVGPQRVDRPAFLHDSIDVVRATLIRPGLPAIGLWPIRSRSGTAGPDRPGAKSPLAPVLSGAKIIHPNSIRCAWSRRTWFATGRSTPHRRRRSCWPGAEGVFTEIASFVRAAAFRPALHITYVKRSSGTIMTVGRRRPWLSCWRLPSGRPAVDRSGLPVRHPRPGHPGQVESVRARSTGGGFAPFDPFSSLTDAALIDMRRMSGR
jgi:hypothetical protein